MTKLYISFINLFHVKFIYVIVAVSKMPEVKSVLKEAAIQIGSGGSAGNLPILTIF